MSSPQRLVDQVADGRTGSGCLEGGAENLGDAVEPEQLRLEAGKVMNVQIDFAESRSNVGFA